MYDLRSKANYFVFTHLRRIFIWENVLVFDISLPVPVRKKIHRVARAKVAENEDIMRLATQFEKFRRGLAERRVKQGNLCFLAYVGEKIVHYRWIAFGETEMDATPRSAHLWKVRISSDSAYMFDAFTVPEYRGLGIGPYVFNEALDYLNKKQISKLFALIDKDNWPSIRAAEKMGYRLVGEIILRKIFKHQVIRYEAKTVEDQQTMKKIVYTVDRRNTWLFLLYYSEFPSRG